MYSFLLMPVVKKSLHDCQNCFSSAVQEDSQPGSFYGRASYTLEDILEELKLGNSSSLMEEIMDQGRKR